MTAPALLVIGMHREELAFGERVATGLDPRDVAVLRVEEGLSGRRPRPDERFRYETRHRELYLQLLPLVRGRHRVLIDLHTGLDQTGPCGDVICADPAFLRCIEAASRSVTPAGSGAKVRTLALDHAPGGQQPWARTVIPSAVWRSAAFLYVGLEIYLGDGGAGCAAEWDFARGLIDMVGRCAGTGGTPVGGGEA